DVGLEPACAVVCPVEAILVGDLNDTDSKVAKVVGREPVTVRRPEKDTRPSLYYAGAHQATLDPLAAELPEGGIFAWAQQAPPDPHSINSGSPRGSGNSSAAAILSYDVGHSVPWDWRVGLYTWTKSISAGAYLVAAALVGVGMLDGGSPLWNWAAPAIGLALLAVTGGLLVWDLEHPTRFYYIFTRPQWKSWLVRGGVLIAAYGALLGLHVVAVLVGAEALRTALVVPGIPLAVMAAVYTACLFAQAKARDLWQNPLLPPHFVVQAALAGAAALLLVAAVLEPSAVDVLEIVLACCSALHLLLVMGELTLPHPTAHARLAAHELTGGRFRTLFWCGVALTALAVSAPLLGPGVAVLGLLGLLAHEHAYVQAAQQVPLA
ncbi:MAG: ferredoxin, partial [Nitriliruptorales bacterium]|nr:ferredoxin [Nitriliruptorales bacterium]